METIVFSKALYGGGSEMRYRDEEGELFIIENAEAYLLKCITEKGFTAELKPRQQYKRLTINQ